MKENKNADNPKIEQIKKHVIDNADQKMTTNDGVGSLLYEDGSNELVKHSYFTDASVLYDVFYIPEGKSVSMLRKEPDFFIFCK